MFNDEEIFNAIQKEKDRQRNNLELIPVFRQ